MSKKRGYNLSIKKKLLLTNISYLIILVVVVAMYFVISASLDHGQEINKEFSEISTHVKHIEFSIQEYLDKKISHDELKAEIKTLRMDTLNCKVAGLLILQQKQK